MSEQSAPLEVVCPRCQAVVAGDATRCWLCHGAIDGPTPASAAASAAAPVSGAATAPNAARMAPIHRAASFSLSTMLLITTLVAICCGLIAAAPGLGIVACVLLAPVLVRTARVVRRREAAGARVSPAEKVGLAATSFVVAMVMATVVGFAAFCCFCAVCAFAYGSSGNEPGLLLLAFGVSVAAGLSIWGFVKLVQWSRRRFERDIEVRK